MSDHALTRHHKDKHTNPVVEAPKLVDSNQLTPKKLKEPYLLSMCTHSSKKSHNITSVQRSTRRVSSLSEELELSDRCSWLVIGAHPLSLHPLTFHPLSSPSPPLPSPIHLCRTSCVCHCRLLSCAYMEASLGQRLAFTEVAIVSDWLGAMATNTRRRICSLLSREEAAALCLNSIQVNPLGTKLPCSRHSPT